MYTPQSDFFDQAAAAAAAGRRPSSLWRRICRSDGKAKNKKLIFQPKLTADLIENQKGIPGK